jgi:hypothetical protein
MRVRTIGVVAGIVAAGLAVFAATGFGDGKAELRSFDTEFSTQRGEVHRVAQPSGAVSASATGRASKAKKAKLLFFETINPIAVGGNSELGTDLECPRGKVVTGYFLPTNTFTMLGLSAPSSRTSWSLGVRNFTVAGAQVIFGIVCENGVK